MPAILNVWYPGTEGGHAVARLLLGDANPGGHLPVSWPRDAGQEPLFYNSKLPQAPQNSGKRYWDLPSSPRYPFGYGLNYADIRVSGLQLAATDVSANAPLRATVTVSNTSAVVGTQVVQLYTHQRAGSTARPGRELKAFAKVTLAPGESRAITLMVPATSLAYWSSATHGTVLEPGTFDVWVGTDSDATLAAIFQLRTP